MNISYNWLKEYININVSPEKLAQILTSIGLEVGGVEEIQTVKGGMEGLVIGEVITCSRHENSDHLSVTTVNVGTGEPLQIVCGAMWLPDKKWWLLQSVQNFIRAMKVSQLKNQKSGA